MSIDPPPQTLVVAIDGPSAAGKSTVARLLARRLGLTFLDTGAMYRAVTLVCLERGIDPDDEQACGQVAAELALSFDSEGHVHIGERPGEPDIRSPEVDRHVSAVSAHAAVRESVVEAQRKVARESGNLVAEGRDTTTVVFPDATHKFYLTASAAERAQRRAAQNGQAHRAAEIQAELERRDSFDSGREHSPLVQAHDALEIVTDGLQLEEVVERLFAAVEGKSLQPPARPRTTGGTSRTRPEAAR